MAILQILKLTGVVIDLGIADGPPAAAKTISSGANGAVYGADTAPALNELTAIGGDCVITWLSTGATEILPSGSAVVRQLRGEAVSVA